MNADHKAALRETLNLLSTLHLVADDFIKQASEKNLSEIQVAGFILSYRAVAQFLEDDMNASRSATVKLEAFDGIMNDMESHFNSRMKELLDSRVKSAMFKGPLHEDDA